MGRHNIAAKERKAKAKAKEENKLLQTSNNEAAVESSTPSMAAQVSATNSNLVKAKSKAVEFVQASEDERPQKTVRVNEAANGSCLMDETANEAMKTEGAPRGWSQLANGDVRKFEKASLGVRQKRTRVEGSSPIENMVNGVGYSAQSQVDDFARIDSLGSLLSSILRHRAVELLLNMRSDGYVLVNDLMNLRLRTSAGLPLSSHSVDDAKEAVRRDTKQQFGLREENGQLLIRANQGHTVNTLISKDVLSPVYSSEEVSEEEAGVALANLRCGFPLYGIPISKSQQALANELAPGGKTMPEGSVSEEEEAWRLPDCCTYTSNGVVCRDTDRIRVLQGNLMDIEEGMCKYDEAMETQGHFHSVFYPDSIRVAEGYRDPASTSTSNASIPLADYYVRNFEKASSVFREQKPRVEGSNPSENNVNSGGYSKLGEEASSVVRFQPCKLEARQNPRVEGLNPVRNNFNGTGYSGQSHSGDFKTGSNGRGGGRGGYRHQASELEVDDFKRIDSLGRLFSSILRHRADKLRLNMRSDGYVLVNDLMNLRLRSSAGLPLSSHTVDDVKEVVRRDTKQRFGLREENGQLLIRANQGHTVNMIISEHVLSPVYSAEEVPVCVHGTYLKNLDAIQKAGLKRMKRLHVHFATGLLKEEGVISDGMKLYRSENGVILAEGKNGVIPPDYFAKVERVMR